jgi:hypothetical protein
MQTGTAVQIKKYAPVAILAITAFSVGLVTASPAAADCTSSSGVTLCSQGDVRGSNTGDGPSGAGPYFPYPCEYDYLCDDDYGIGVAFDFDADVGRPDRPNRPNRPGRRGGGRR